MSAGSCTMGGKLLLGAAALLLPDAADATGVAVGASAVGAVRDWAAGAPANWAWL